MKGSQRLNYLGNRFLKMDADQHMMRLNHLGCETIQLNGKLCCVKYKTEHMKLSYVYNITKSNHYFLERVSPYPLPLKEYDKEEDVIENIRIDIEQFKSAEKSKNIDSFIKVNKELAKTAKAFEDLFLYYNVQTFHTDIILEKIEEIKQEIMNTVKDSERIYRESDPIFLDELLKDYL